MSKIALNSNKDPKPWRARVIASEDKGVAIPSSHPPCQIIDRLYISNMLTASLCLKGIAPAYYKAVPQMTHVLSIISGRTWQSEVIQKTTESAIVQKKIFIKDEPNANLLEHFPGNYVLSFFTISCSLTNQQTNKLEICSFIHSALALPNARVLVHCYAGISRSASAIAAYLIWAQYISDLEAITLLRFRRPEVNPNPGFRDQLMAWCEMDCELLDGANLPKEKYITICRALRLKKDHPNVKALRRFERPGGSGVGTVKKVLPWTASRP